MATEVNDVVSVVTTVGEFKIHVWLFMVQLAWDSHVV